MLTINQKHNASTLTKATATATATVMATMSPAVLLTANKPFLLTTATSAKKIHPRPLPQLNLPRHTTAFLGSTRTNPTFSAASPPRAWLSLCSSSKAAPESSEADAGPVQQDTLIAHDGVLDKDEAPSWRVHVGTPATGAPSLVPARPKLSLSDQAFFLLAFIACTTSVAFTSLVIAAVPTLYAMGRAAISLSKLADTAREELPSTMAAIRLSGMEISDLTLELSDLSQEIADGVNKSAQAVQTAEAGIRQMGSLARQRTMSMIEERANLPVISLQPVVAGAAKKTSHAVGKATKTFVNMISRAERSSENENKNKRDNSVDSL